MGRGRRCNEVHPLSANQLRVVLSLAKGERYRDIAQAMGVSIGTVSAHRKAALSRLGLHTNGDLTRWAYIQRHIR